jgi:hypothetical protein
MAAALSATLLKHGVKRGAMLIGGSPQQIRLTTNVDEDIVQMPLQHKPIWF